MLPGPVRRPKRAYRLSLDEILPNLCLAWLLLPRRRTSGLWHDDCPEGNPKFLIFVIFVQSDTILLMT